MKPYRILLAIVVLLACTILGCEPPITSLEVTPKMMTLYNEADAQALTVKATDRDGVEVKDPLVVWKSSDPGIVAVDDKGGLSINGSGTTVITAVLDKLKQETTVTVDLCKKLTVEPLEVAVRPGATSTPVVRALNERNMPSGAPIKWSVSDNNIASVDGNGMITGIAIGQTTVTVECGDQSATVRLNVMSPEPLSTDPVPDTATANSADVETVPDDSKEAAEATMDKIDGDRAVDVAN